MSRKNQIKNIFVSLALALLFLSSAGVTYAAFYYDTVSSYSVISGLTSAQLDTTCYLSTDFVNGQFCTGGKRPQDLDGTNIACKSDAEIKTAMQTQWTSGKQYTCKTNATPNMCSGNDAWTTSCATGGNPQNCTASICCRTNYCTLWHREAGTFDICNDETTKSLCGPCLAGWQDADDNLGTVEACIEAVPENYWTKTVNNISNNNTGNIGIGIANPNEKLEVANTSGARVVFSDAGGANRNTILFEAPQSTRQYGRIEAYNYGTSAGLPLVFNTVGGGNVGIGTTAPDELLHVYGTTAGIGAHIGNAYMGVWDGGTSFAAFTHNSLKSTTDSYALLQSNAGMTYLNAAEGQDINFRINNLTKIILDQDGNVGVGTTVPSQKLHVEGSIRLTNQLTWGTPYFHWDSGTSYFRMLNGSSAAPLKVGGLAVTDSYTNSAPANGAYIQGNVGIGVTTPVSRLQLGNNVAIDALDNFSEYQLLLYQSAAAINSYGIGVRSGTLAFNTNDDFDFDQDGVTVMTIDNGNVGIGTELPGYKLEVADRMKINSDNAGMWIEAGSTDWFIGRNGSDGTGTNLRFYNNGDKVTIQSDGNVGIGTTAPAYNLQVMGADGDSSIGFSVGRGYDDGHIYMYWNDAADSGVFRSYQAGNNAPLTLWGSDLTADALNGTLKLAGQDINIISDTGNTDITADATDADVNITSDHDDIVIDAQHATNSTLTLKSGQYVDVRGDQVTITGDYNDDMTFGGIDLKNVRNGTTVNGLPQNQISMDNDGDIGLYSFYGGNITIDASGDVTSDGNIYMWGFGSGTGSTVLRSTGGQLLLSTSSIRYKENVKDLEDYSWIYKVRPVTFNYKPEYSADNETRYGFIAEEVNEIDKQTIVYDEEGLPQDVMYTSFVPLLLKAIQDQKEEIDLLKNKIEILGAGLQ